MSSFAEYMADQEAITSRYEELDELGKLAHGLGAEIETCEDDVEALKFCSDRQGEMDTEEQITFTKAVSEDLDYYVERYGISLEKVRGLTKMGELALDLGADAETCMDPDKASDYCSDNSEKLSENQKVLYDAAVAEHAMSHGEGGAKNTM